MKLKYLLIIAVVVGAIYSYNKTPSKLEVLSTSVSNEVLNSEQITTDTRAQLDNRLQHADVFNVEHYIEPNRITIVEFYTRRCPGCKRLEGHYQQLFKARPDVVVKRILMPDNWSVVWARKQFSLEIASTPHVMIYGLDGSAIAVDEGLDKQGFTLLYEWMNKELVGVRS